MNPNPPTASATDQEIVEALAEFIGWHVYEDGEDVEATFDWQHGRYPFCYWSEGEARKSHLICQLSANEKERDFRPLTDWNHWRQVEEKLMEDMDEYGGLYERFLDNVWAAMKDQDFDYRWVDLYMKADLRTRCVAAVAALSTIPLPTDAK